MSGRWDAFEAGQRVGYWGVIDGSPSAQGAVRVMVHPKNPDDVDGLSAGDLASAIARFLNKNDLEPWMSFAEPPTDEQVKSLMERNPLARYLGLHLLAERRELDEALGECERLSGPAQPFDAEGAEAP